MLPNIEGLAFANDGTLIIADENARALYSLDENGVFETIAQGGILDELEDVVVDPDGNYIKKFIPELNKLPKKFIHEPWKADSAILKNSDIKLGDTYPNPIVDHKFARERALNKYAELRK